MKFRLLAIVVLAIGISSICLYGQNYPVFYEGAIAATDNARVDSILLLWEKAAPDDPDLASQSSES
jgi:hypothetical protein